MKRKQFIIISAAVLAVLIAVFAFSAAKGALGEKQTESTKSLSESQSVSVQTPAQNGETSEPAAEQKRNGSTTQKNAAAPSENKNNTKTTTQRETSAKTTTATERNTSSAQSKTITVTVAVNCKNALAAGADVPESGYIIGKTSVTLKNGQTVFDALEAACDKNGVSLTYQSKSYITGIGGLNEKDCGGASGWMYRVNGTNPMKAAAKYALKNGDTVEWYYVTDSNDK